MLARVDIVSVNCPSTPATFHLLSARRLALIQPTAVIVNTARGVLDSRDICFYLILTALFLCLNTQFLKLKR